jgi:hypothetical protein
MMARAASLGMAALALAASFFVLVQAAERLDRRFLETRYVVDDLGGCWIGEWRPFEFYTACPGSDT